MAEEKARKTVPREIGASGISSANNQIFESEMVPDLRFPYSIKTFQEMKSDSIIAGALTMIKQFMRKVDWGVEPYGGMKATDEDKRKAEIIEKALFKDMKRSFDQVITDICSFIENGFAFFEPTYQVSNGLILWKDIAARHASTIKGFKFDNHGYLKSIEQYKINTENGYLNTHSTVEIPVSRLLHFRTDSEKNNPLGRSLLKNPYRAWYFKTKLEEHEAIGVEREMNGLPLIKIPSEYFAADPNEDPESYAVLQEFIKMGRNARNNEQACVIHPSDTDEAGKEMFSFELISSNGTRSLDTSKIIERYDYRIAQSLISDFLLIGSGSSGSFALSDNKISSFVKSLEAYLEVIAEQFNRIAIPRVYEMNGWDSDRVCQLTHKPIGSATISELGDFLDKADAFLTPDETLENALRKRADLPERDVEKEYIDKPTATHQALSQRIGMEASAKKNSNDASDNPSNDNEEETELEKSLKKVLEGNYTGES